MFDGDESSECSRERQQNLEPEKVKYFLKKIETDYGNRC